MKMRKRILFLGMMLTAGLLRADLTLARRSRPADCSIVRHAQAAPAEVYAAEELKKFVWQISGVDLPIVTDSEPLPEKAILLGRTRYSEKFFQPQPDWKSLGDDGFVLKTQGRYLLIAGGNPRGTLYGVYDVLERFGGCRWYSSKFSVVPEKPVLSVPELDETQRPAFLSREPYWYDIYNGDFAVRNKVNGSSIRISEKHGGKIRFGGGLFVHTFELLCPVDEFFDAHPEYFSEINGKRIRNHPQLCLTNPDVVKLVTQRVLERIRKDPTAKIFSVSQNDWRNPCTCPKCRTVDEREESHAGTMIAFVNQVAEAVEKEFPDVWIETLAYQYTRKPPKHVRPRGNVVPRLCSIECDFLHPLDKSAYEENRRFVEEIKAWSAITDKLYVWDYVTNFGAYLAPFPNLNALQGNVRFFRDNNVKGLFEQGAYQGGHAEFAELKAWLLAKWMWNPELPQETLMADFLNGYYGPAAPFVKGYLDLVYAKFADLPSAKIFDGAGVKFDRAFFEKSGALWASAEAAVKNDPARLRNVRMSGMSELYLRLARTPRVWCASNATGYLSQEEVRIAATELLKRIQESGTVRLSESKDRHDEMILSWRELSERGASLPQGGTCRTIIEDKLLNLMNRGKWGDTVKDSLASDGSALKLYTTHFEWCTTLPFESVAFDAGAKYRIRARLRFEKTGKDGKAFWAGVYDSVAKKSACGMDRSAAEVSETYAWYAIGEFVPNSGQRFWIGPGVYPRDLPSNPAVTAVYIDCLELEKLP